MLFGENFIADRQPESCALATRLCGEKRLEELVPDFGGNAASVVAHPHLDAFAKIARSHGQRRFELPVVCFSPALVRGIESIAEEIEEHARDILRHKRDRRDILAVSPFYRHVEVLILSAGAVIGEIERLVDQGVEIDAFQTTAAAAGMSQHAFDDIVSALAMLNDPLEVADQHFACLIDFAALSLVERRKSWRGGLVQLAQQAN